MIDIPMLDGLNAIPVQPKEDGYTLQELRDGRHLDDLKEEDTYRWHTDAYETALGKLAEWAWDTIDMEYQIDWWKEQAGERGWSDLEFSWSISYSQGDGVQIVGGWLDVRAWLKFHKRSNTYRAIFANADDITVSIGKGYGSGGSTWGILSVDYAGEQSIVDFDTYVPGRGFAPLNTPLARQLADFEDTLQDELRDFEGTFYRQARDEVDYLTSEESALESAEANEYRFDNTGRLD